MKNTNYYTGKMNFFRRSRIYLLYERKLLYIVPSANFINAPQCRSLDLF